MKTPVLPKGRQVVDSAGAAAVGWFEYFESIGRVLRDAVFGGRSLTNAGAIPKVSATDGTLEESAILDDGTDVSVTSRRLLQTTYAANALILQRRANGTAGAPTAVLNTQALGYHLFRGFGSTAFPALSSAWIAALATQDHTDTAHGTRIQIAVTPNGSASAAEVVSIDSDGVEVTGDHDVTGVYKVGGTQVVGAQQADPGTLAISPSIFTSLPSGTAGATYTATEQGMLNSLKTAVGFLNNDVANLQAQVDNLIADRDSLRAVLQAHGLMA